MKSTQKILPDQKTLGEMNSGILMSQVNGFTGKLVAMIKDLLLMVIIGLQMLMVHLIQKIMKNLIGDLSHQALLKKEILLMRYQEFMVIYLF